MTVPSSPSDRRTIELYEQGAEVWRSRRTPDHQAARAFGDTLGAQGLSGPIIDLGCGPGWLTQYLGPDAVALDGARAMLDLVPEFAPAAPRVQGDVADLPVRDGALAGALAARVYVHLPRSEVPAALGDLHRALRVHAPVELVVFGDEPAELRTIENDLLDGRQFSVWDHESLTDTLIGAGFAIDDWSQHRPDGSTFTSLTVRLRRRRSLADTLGSGLELVICGLNPSLHAADAGVGFVSPSNRFWPAALAAELVTVDRDPWHAFRRHRVGMTDLVKRATTKASEVDADEYRAGLARLERQLAWLQPAAVCFVGLAGWRAAVDPKATAGWQTQRLAGVPVYLMPSTSGLNASSQLPDFVEHLRAVREPPPDH
ncbi:MAG: uracil-DNA glycosylase family protein [Acidimicrobiales bacterium]